MSIFDWFRKTQPSTEGDRSELGDTSDAADERIWNDVYSERQRFFEQHFGKLPDDIQKMMNLFGVWPGGGLFVFQADKLNNLWIHTTFGLTNPDMPATTRTIDHQAEMDEAGRVVGSSNRLVKKETIPEARSDVAGYGYELIVLTRQKEDWPLGLLQWAVNAEILNDVGILDRVEQYNGLTIEDINTGYGPVGNVLIAEARPPIPARCELPNGAMKLLVITTITEDEMQYSFEHGKDALLNALVTNGVGQVSDRNRVSVTN